MASTKLLLQSTFLDQLTSYKNVFLKYKSVVQVRQEFDDKYENNKIRGLHSVLFLDHEMDPFTFIYN